jgi:integrase
MARKQGEPTGFTGIKKVASTKFKRGFGYEVRANARHASGGQPEQTFATLDEAKKWKSSVETKVAEGTFIGKSPLTVAEAVEQWLKSQRGERNTRAAREAALAPVVKQYGKHRAQAITKRHVEQLLDALVGGRIDGVQDRSVRYTNVTRTKWAACWEDLVAQGVLPRNVVALVKPLKDTEPDDSSGGGDAIDETRRLTDEQIKVLIKAHAPYMTTVELKGHALRSERSRLRRSVFIELALLGLRRAELEGLRWSAISGLHGKAPTLSVVRTRVAASGLIEDKRKGKTGAAKRTLLLPPTAAEALRRHQLIQMGDKKRSGARWRGDKDLAILTVDNGAAASPRTLDDWWHAAMDAAGITGYRLHDMRHTCASRLLGAGVPLMDVATWLGHADGGVLALRVYGHTDPKDLGRAAAALAHP